MITGDQLLKRAYETLVRNCVYQQDINDWAAGIRLIKAIGEHIGIKPSTDTAHAIESVASEEVP